MSFCFARFVRIRTGCVEYLYDATVQQYLDGLCGRRRGFEAGALLEVGARSEVRELH